MHNREDELALQQLWFLFRVSSRIRWNPTLHWSVKLCTVNQVDQGSPSAVSKHRLLGNLVCNFFWRRQCLQTVKQRQCQVK